jgi:hypothetical protein
MKNHFATTTGKSVLFTASILMLLTIAAAAQLTNSRVLGAQPKGATVQQEQRSLDVSSGISGVSCKPIGVGVFENRVHIRCERPNPFPLGTPDFFAVPTSNSAKATRFLNMFTAAYTSGRALYITWNPLDLSGESFGCLNSDCKIPLDAQF